MVKRKSLLIGINYTGQQNSLRGCQQDVQNMAGFLVSRGYPTDPGNMVVMTDARQGPYYPSGHNILAAMQWLVSEPQTICFLHYSGHGSQVRDPDGDRDSGFDDTIVPVDYQKNGQIDSDKLHRTLVSALPRNSTLTVIFDCCHSGSALELPFVYKTDEYGNINLVDQAKQGFQLLNQASLLIQGGFSMSKVGQAKQLIAGAQDFFKGLQHRGESQPDGLQEENFVEDWSREGKTCFMFSGCRDDQTSADASIGGQSVGAMSWAFLETMRRDTNWNMTYIQILTESRALLKQRYQQVPQLSCGYKFDLNRPFSI